MTHSKGTFPAVVAREGTAGSRVSVTLSGATCGAGHSSTHFSPALRVATAAAASLARSAAPARVAQGLLLFFIQLYRLTFSPAQVFLFGGGSGCRFTPTCSQYAAEAIRHHGAGAGSVMAFKRICRCHPLGNCGHDPVPKRQEEKALLISNG